MTNSFVLLCQSFLNRIPRSDRDNISYSIPLAGEHPVFANIHPQAGSLGLHKQSLPTQANIKSAPSDYPAGTPSANVRVAATSVVRCSDKIGMLPLADGNPDKERGSSDSMTAAPQGLALASLHSLPLLHKQATALAQHNVSVAKLPHQESLTLRVLSTIAWLAGVTAILAGCSSNSVSSDSPTSSSRVSSFSPQDINNYASAVIAIEQSRRAAYKDIQAITKDEKIPDITCTQEDTIKGVEQSIQDIAVKYCKKAQQLVRTQSLTISRFNDITSSAESDPALRKQIQNELLRIQR